MKLIKSVVFTLISFVYFSPLSNGDITIEYQIAELFLADETTPIPTNTLGIIVTNVDGNASLFPDQNSLLGLTINVGATFGVSSNFIIGAISASDGGGVIGLFDSQTYSLGTYAGWATGDPLAIYWFPGITSTGVTIGAGQSYGFLSGYGINTASGGTMGLSTPNDPGNYSAYFFNETNAPGSGISDSQFSANLTVIPEPGVAVLFGLGFLGLILRRRLS